MLRRFRRLIFPSPAELEFIRIFGGKYKSSKRIRDPKTGFPLTIVYSMGKILKRELIKREVRAGAMWIDFGALTNYFNRGIEIDGRAYHRDILKEQERDEYVAQYGWSLLHIEAGEVYRNPNFVQRKVLEFLAR
jgi:very-short-patch-repair endonuclease